MSKLNLDRDKIQYCRQMAKRIAERVYQQVDAFTTTAIERASLRFLGIEDAVDGVPVVNRIVDSIPPELKGRGVCYWFGRGLASQRTSPIALALRVAGGKVQLTELPDASPEEIDQALAPMVRKGMERLHAAAKRKKDMETRWPSRSRPLKYLSIGTGDIHQDVEQAVMAVKTGADCIGQLRSSGQSLMEVVPQGETQRGNEGTFATQANFHLLRQALDQVSADTERYIRLVAHSSGLCMPEIAVIGSFENVDYLLNDAMYGILFRDLNAKRSFADQRFARLVLAHSGIIINSGEDAYLAHSESYRVFPQALASHFMNEQFSFLSRLQEWQMGFSHAYEIDPEMEDGFLHEVAQAQTVRECFPKAPIKYKPPTRHKTGDIFYSQLMDGLFTMVGAMTHQDIQQLGSATEAIHHPLIMDRYWSLKAANYVLKNTRSLGDEIQWSQNGKVVRRARGVLDGAFRLLEKIEKAGGLLKAIADGHIANVARNPEHGLGGEGLIPKNNDYYNPVWRALVEASPRDMQIAPASHRRFSSYRGRGGEGRTQRGGESRSRGGGEGRAQRGGEGRSRGGGEGRARGGGEGRSRGGESRSRSGEARQAQRGRRPARGSRGRERPASPPQSDRAAASPPQNDRSAASTRREETERQPAQPKAPQAVEPRKEEVQTAPSVPPSVPEPVTPAPTKPREEKRPPQKPREEKRPPQKRSDNADRSEAESSKEKAVEVKELKRDA